jgi:Fe-S-cluster containining protein
VSAAAGKRALDELYAELPVIACRGECHSSCGPIQMSRLEWQRIIRKLGYEPRARIRLHDPRSLTCPMLSQNRCTVYAIRPLICRLWGIAEGLECPWGCRPEPRYLTKLEAFDFMLRVEAISQPEHAEAIERERAHFAAHPELVQSVGNVLIEQPTREGAA